jgi:hypothetical protein
MLSVIRPIVPLLIAYNSYLKTPLSVLNAFTVGILPRCGAVLCMHPDNDRSLPVNLE